MTEEKRHNLASQRAEEYAPVPANTAIISGIVGATVIGMLIFALSGFYFIDIPHYWIAFSLLVVLGFMVPFVSSAYRRRKHVRATSAELRKINEGLQHKRSH